MSIENLQFVMLTLSSLLEIFTLKIARYSL